MQTLADTRHGPANAFAATHWTVIAAACRSQEDAEGSRLALSQLCETYWPPLYSYARGRGFSAHDSQDLTQGFFAYLLETKIYKQTEPAKGKFRSFLLASFKNFLCDARDRARALKRGGGYQFISLEEGRVDAVESLFQTNHSLGPDGIQEDRLFERAWARTLVATALEEVRSAYKREGKEAVFRDLQPFLSAGATPLPSYSDLALRLGIAESTLRSHVTRLRARYREALRSEVRRTVNTEAEVDGELRELLRILAAS